MHYLKRQYKTLCCWLLPWLCAALFASCSFDDDFGQADSGVATLQFNITAREEDDLNTRVVTEVGTSNEYMHNLLVLLVQGDKVVKKFLPDLSQNTAAQTGALQSWTSEHFTLASGSYTVYAFANIDTYYDGHWGSLTGLEEGKATITGLGIDDIVLEENPAEKLDFPNFFIPMSAKEQIEVTSDTKEISINLDRLVSKIRMSVSGKAGTKVTALSFGGYADRIGLFSGTALGEDVSYATTKTLTVPTEGWTLNEEGKLTIPDFYVNSSPAEHPFTVNLTTDEGKVVTYQATTARNELPRNSIFPLTLQLNVYGLDLKAECWVSPIGSLPVPVTVSVDKDTYEVNVPEGCQFAFTVGVVGEAGSSSHITDVKSTWEITEGITGITFDGKTSGVQTVKGHVTAAAGRTFELKAQVEWKVNGSTCNRIYTIKLYTESLTEFPLSAAESQNSSSRILYLSPEMLNLFIK